MKCLAWVCQELYIRTWFIFLFFRNDDAYMFYQPWQWCKVKQSNSSSLIGLSDLNNQQEERGDILCDLFGLLFFWSFLWSLGCCMVLTLLMLHVTPHSKIWSLNLNAVDVCWHHTMLPFKMHDMVWKGPKPIEHACIAYAQPKNSSVWFTKTGPIWTSAAFCITLLIILQSTSMSNTPSLSPCL